MKVWIFDILMVFIAVWVCSDIGYGKEARSVRSVPDFGVMFNNDGDLSFLRKDPTESMLLLESLVSSLAGTPVKTFMFSIGSGSDILNYPTKVSSTWGWQRTKHDDESSWGTRIRNGKAGIAAGVDAPRVAGQKAKELGLMFVPSFRMNDNHFIFDPLQYPLTGKFWVEHRQYAINKSGESPIPGHPEYANLFDFSHKQVRQYRLAVIFEMIDRYQDIMDGIELDFNRVQVLFPKGKAQRNAHLITELLEQVRQRLDETGKKNGKTYYLFVRVPPTPKNCRWAGLDISEWMEKRLVDVLIPAQLMTLSSDMPIDEFVKLCKPAGCKVYPAIYPRSSYSWAFTDKPTAGKYASAPGRRATVELIRGALSNYWYMGASGFQMYNFGFPDSDWAWSAFRSAAGPEALTGFDRTYSITGGYYLDYTDTYQYKKQLPADLEKGKTSDFRLIIGDNFGAGGSALKSSYCGLRLGFREVDGEADFEVKLNGRVVHSGQGKLRLTDAKGGTSRASWGAYTAPATKLLQIPIEDFSVLRQGSNKLELVISEANNKEKMQLVLAQVGVKYNRRAIFIWK